MKPDRLACAISVIGLLSATGTVWAQSTAPDRVQSGVMLPGTIPIFPLPDPMLFPKVSRPLHIFEPRYRAMVADALKGDRIIGMVTLRPGYEADYEGRPPVYAIGCAGVITDIEELPDGRFNLVLQGLVKFRITAEDNSRAYRLARVDAMPESSSEEERAALRNLRPELEAVLAAAAGPSRSGPVPPEIPDEDLVNTLAQYLDFDPLDRQDLLEQSSVISRSQVLIDLLQKKLNPPR